MNGSLHLPSKEQERLGGFEQQVGRELLGISLGTCGVLGCVGGLGCDPALVTAVPVPPLLSSLTQGTSLCMSNLCTTFGLPQGELHVFYIYIYVL